MSERFLCLKQPLDISGKVKTCNELWVGKPASIICVNAANAMPCRDKGDSINNNWFIQNICGLYVSGTRRFFYDPAQFM